MNGSFKMSKKLLIAFDFDHTVVDDNTDIVVRKLVSDDKVPSSVRQIYKSESWTVYMREIFKILHKNQVSPDDIIKSVQRIRPVPDLLELFKFLKENDAEVIIISDSNSVFISEWLQYHKVSDVVSSVFTNPAYFDESNLLNIDMYHEQHFCTLSAVNLCKGFILEKYISDCLEKGIVFEKVAFVGDGSNDLCPSLKLKKNDYIFARIGYSLHALLQKPETKYEATLYPWSSAKDIMKVLF